MEEIMLTELKQGWISPPSLATQTYQATWINCKKQGKGEIPCSYFRQLQLIKLLSFNTERNILLQAHIIKN